MYTDNFDCFYDGFKIRIPDPVYVEKMFQICGQYGIRKQYNENKDLKYPFYGNFLGCERTKDNSHSDGFKVGFVMESLNGQNVICFEIGGSLHKFFNNWNHNAGSFNFYQAKEAINKIKQIFQIKNEMVRLCNIEIGTNIIILDEFNISSKELASNVLFSKNRSKKENKTNMDRNKVGHTFFLSNETTRSKVYAKSFQQPSFSSNNQIIRIESVICKSRSIEKALKISTFDDLANPEVHKKAVKYFQKRFKNILFYQNEIESKTVSREEKSLLLDFCKEDYWEVLFKKCKKEFYNHKKGYFEILDKYNVSNVSTYILEQILKH